MRKLACKQALPGALAAARREKEGKLATSRCEMRIGGDDISNDVITLDTSFSMLHSRWLEGFSRLSRQGATGELEVEFKFQRRSCKLSFLFPPRRQSVPGSLITGYEKISVGHSWTTLWNLTLTQFLNITAESELLLSMTIPGLSTSLTCLSSCTSCMLL